MKIEINIPKPKPQPQPPKFPCFGQLRTDPQVVVYFTRLHPGDPQLAHGFSVTGNVDAAVTWGWQLFDVIPESKHPEFRIVGGKPSFGTGEAESPAPAPSSPRPIEHQTNRDPAIHHETGRAYPYLGASTSSGRLVLFLGPTAKQGREILGKGWGFGPEGSVYPRAPDSNATELSQYTEVKGDFILRNIKGVPFPALYEDTATGYIVMRTAPNMWWFVKGCDGKFSDPMALDDTFWFADDKKSRVRLLAENETVRLHMP